MILHEDTMTEKQTILISGSQLDYIQTCPRLHYYRNILRIFSIEDKSEPLQKGDLIHYLLELHYKSIMAGELLSLENIANLGLNKATELSLSLEDTQKVIHLYEEYRDFYPVGNDWLPEEVEVPFAKVVYEDDDLRIIDEGKIDLLAKNNKLSLSLVIDHKYSSHNSQVVERETQNLNYCLVTGRRDFIINQLGDQKSLDVEKRMLRPYFCYGEHEIEEFRNDLIYWTLEIVRNHARALANDYIPANRKSCFSFFKKCAYYDLCQTTPDNFEYKVKSEFIRSKETVGLFK